MTKRFFEIDLTVPEGIQDAAVALLSEFGFEGFEQDGDRLRAYIPEQDFSLGEIELILSNLKIEKPQAEWYFLLEDKNWNSEWEKSMEPIAIGDQVWIRPTFKAPNPQFPIDLQIDPKMAFGTGHHGTTSLVMEELLSLDIKGKTVMDAGCGTGILGILGSKLGAKEVFGFDVEDQAILNSEENAALNKVENIRFKKGNSSVLITENQSFDIVLANITKGILLEELSVYLKYLAKNGVLVLSGFFEEDIPLMKAEVETRGLHFVNKQIRNSWACLTFKTK